MATLAGELERPQKLIRWHYLWYVALALAVMIAAIVIGNVWFLNWVHVMSGILWTGIDLFMGFVIGPILRRVDMPVRTAVLTRLTPVTVFLLPTSLRVCFELQKARPDGRKIGRMMSRFYYVVASQGIMQVAIVVVMARLATGV